MGCLATRRLSSATAAGAAVRPRPALHAAGHVGDMLIIILVFTVQLCSECIFNWSCGIVELTWTDWRTIR